MSSNPKIQNQPSLSQTIPLLNKKHKKCIERTSQLPKDVLKESQGNEITKNYNLDDLDDSFDLFMPKKNNKTMASTSTSTRSAKRKSPYFEEDIDSDMKLAMELSIQENYKGTERSSVIKKLCSVPPLLRRTQAEREKIITEKVAIILMDDKENKTGEPSCSNQVLSNSLQVQLDQNARLWKMSQQELINTKEFYINSIVKYDNAGINLKHNEIIEENRSEDIETSVCQNYNGQLESRAEEENNSSRHDIFQDSYAQNNEPLEIYESPCRNTDPPNVDINYFEIFKHSDDKNNETLDKTQSNPVICDSNKSDSVSMTDLLDKVCHQIFQENNESDKKSVCSISSVQTLKNDQNIYEEDTLIGVQSPKTINPQAIVDKWVLQVKALKSLSDDMEKVWLYPESNPISIVCLDHTFIMQSSILFSRCPLLYKEIRKHKLSLTQYRFKECEPFFKYITTGKTDIFETLNSDSLYTILGLSKKYELSLLTEVISIIIQEMDLTIDLSVNKDLDDDSYEMNISQQVKKFYMNKTKANVPCYIVESDDEDVKPVIVPELITIDSDSNISEPRDTNNSNQMLENFIANEFPFFTYLSTDIPEVIDLAKDPPREAPPFRTDHLPRISVIPDSRMSYHDNYTQKIDERKLHTSISEIIDEISDSESNQFQSESNRQIFSTPGGRIVSVSEKATPKPDYQGMRSPELKKQLSNYGIKPNLGKRKGVQILNYIYDQLHPDRSNPATQAALDLCKSNISNQPSTSKKALSFFSPKPRTKKSESPKKSSHFRPISPRPSTSRDFLPLRSSNEESENLFSLRSSNSENLLEIPLSDCSSDSETCEIAKSTIESSDEDTEPSEILHLISPLVDTINSDFFLKRHILLHKPIWLDSIKTILRERGVECNSQELKDGLKHLMDRMEEQYYKFFFPYCSSILSILASLIKNINQQKEKTKEKNRLKLAYVYIL